MKGSILISTLLILLVLTGLAMAVLSTGLLESKMSVNYRDQLFSRQKAEQNLLQQEQLISIAKELPKNIELISQAICGVTFYRVTAVGEYNNMKTTLQSTYALVDPTAPCNPPPQISSGRKSWRLI